MTTPTINKDCEYGRGGFCPVAEIVSEDPPESGPCPTCSCEQGEPGQLVIRNVRQWLKSPIPCPDCHNRSLARASELGRKVAERIELDLLRRMGVPTVLRLPNPFTTRGAKR